MNGGYVMIDLGTFGFNNAVANKSAVDKIKDNLGKKPLYFKFHRVDKEEDEEIEVGEYVFYGNVFNTGSEYVIPLLTQCLSATSIGAITITIKKSTNEFSIDYAEANYTEE